MEKNYKIRFTVQHLIFIVLFIFVNVYLYMNYGPVKTGINQWSGKPEEVTHPYNVIWLVLTATIVVAWLIFVLDEDWEPFGYKDNGFYQEWSFGSGGISKRSWLFWLLLVFVAYHGYKFTGNLAKVYNGSVVYYKQYDKLKEAKRGFYDMLWKTYIQKEKITNLSKDVFLVVTKMIMENRKDGQQLAWKWVHENQNIPFEEFTVFYRDLSNFIESKREQYFQLEMQAQDLVNAHNMLIDTFPHNLYNKILKREPLVFSYGFLSDSTRKVFESGNENVK